jgi:hypothetical protein
MTGAPCFVTRGGKPERLHRLPAVRIHHRGGILPSDRYGARWRSLPVEGSKAWRDARPGLLGRLFNR